MRLKNLDVILLGHRKVTGDHQQERMAITIEAGISSARTGCEGVFDKRTAGRSGPVETGSPAIIRGRGASPAANKSLSAKIGIFNARFDRMLIHGRRVSLP